MKHYKLPNKFPLHRKVIRFKMDDWWQNISKSYLSNKIHKSEQLKSLVDISNTSSQLKDFNCFQPFTFIAKAYCCDVRFILSKRA